MKQNFGALILGLGFAYVMTGCLEGPAENPSLQNRSANEATENGLSVIFTDAFADGGSLQVMRDENAQLGYSVMAPLGSRAEQLMLQSSESQSLADVFTVLHEGRTEVPAELKALSETRAKQEIEGRAKAAAEVDTFESVQPLIVSDESAFAKSFINTLCTIKKSDFVYHPVECYANQRAHHLVTNEVMSAYDDGLFFRKDMTRAWNGSEWEATLTIYKTQKKLTVKPKSALWVTWGGTYFNSKASINLPTGRLGPIGITAHRPFLF